MLRQPLRNVPDPSIHDQPGAFRTEAASRHIDSEPWCCIALSVIAAVARSWLPGDQKSLD